MRPLFTIGMPVYNAMPYLAEAVESVLRQTYPHFELLIINDGSRDESLEYLRSLNDSRLRIISQENRGLTATLNRMLEEARAPWLVRLDADDVACPERLALVVGAIERNPAAGMFYSRASHYGHPRTIAATRSTEGTPADLHELTRAGYLLAIVHSSVVLNVAKTRALGGYRFDLHIEDLDLWWRMALRHGVVFIPSTTVQYRLSNNSTCISDLGSLSANTLFAQYLLLSHLWGLQPQSYEAVIGALNGLVDRSRLAYREQMWLAATRLTARRYSRAAPHLAKAAVHSPVHFMRRVRYPFSRDAMVRIGEDPQRFRRIQQQLWGAPELAYEAMARAFDDAPPHSLTSDIQRNALRSRFPRARIGRALVDCCSFTEAVDAITRHAALGGSSACVVTPNAQHIVLLESDASLREAYANADLVVADGASLLVAARLLGEKLRERVVGVDLFERLCGKAAELGLRVFFLGGRPGSAQLAAKKLRQRFPCLSVAGTCCPPLGFERDERELQAVGDAIRATRPDLVFVALGSPKQESWMHRYGRRAGAPVLIGVGGSFEIVGGVCRRAPRFLQRSGCEWLFRLLLEPRRLWKRYLIGNCRFLRIVMQQAGRRRWPRPQQDVSTPAPRTGHS